MKRILAASLLAAASLVAPLADLSPAQTAPAATVNKAKDDGSAAILPFLDEGTFLVARLDVDKVKPETLEKLMNAAADKMIKAMNPPAEQQARMKQEVQQGYEQSKQWLADMKDAGAKQVYFLLLNAGDLREHEDDPVVVVPLANGADADRISGLLKQNFGRRSEGATVKNAVVFGKPKSTERLHAHVAANAAPGVDATDLAAALAGAGGEETPLRIAALPGESTRAWIEENLPEIPAPIGGGDTKTLSRGVKWASVAVLQKDKPTAMVTIRGTDAAQTKALHDLLQKSLEFAKQMLAGAPGGEDTAKQVGAIKPKLQNETISMTIDPVGLFVGLRSSRMETRAQPGPNPPPPGAKPDDGGL